MIQRLLSPQYVFLLLPYSYTHTHTHTHTHTVVATMCEYTGYFFASLIVVSRFSIMRSKQR